MHGCVCVCVCMCVGAFPHLSVQDLFLAGLLSSFFGNKGPITFVNVLEPSNCSKGSMCNFWKRAFGILPPPLGLPN